MVVYKKELIEHIATTKNPDAPLTTGVWCSKSFCPAIAACPAVQKEVQENAIVDFSNNPVLHPDINELSIEQLMAVKNKAKLINSFVAQCIIQLQKHAEAGVEIPGQKLVRTKKHRAWINKKVAWDTLHKIYDKKMLEEKLRSPAEMELVMKRDGSMELFDSLVKKPKGTPTLVPISDKRPAIVATVFTDFEKTEENL